MIRRKNNKNSNPILYGLHAVREAWLNDARAVQALYITAQAQRSFDKTISEGVSRGLRRPKPTVVDSNKLDKMLPKGAVHQGIALNCSQLDEMDERDLAILYHLEKRAFITMLDQVTDPHNVGAIIRSASAFGMDGLIMQKKHSPALDGVLAKTACGGIDHLKIATATNLSRAIEELQAGGFLVVGLDERAEHTIDQLQEVADAVNRSPNSSAQSANNKLAVAGTPRIKTPEKVVLVLGSEGSGLRHNIREKCDSLIKLPTQGAIKSLNVSNAAAIAFYVVTQAKNAQK